MNVCELILDSNPNVNDPKVMRRVDSFSLPES